jgi:hypothetical protein
MIGASQVQPTGSDGYLYYEVVESCQSAPSPAAVTNIYANLNAYQSGGGASKRVGVFAYDWANARWAFISLKSLLFVNNGWINDQGAIKDFCASLATPVSTDENGNNIPVPAAVGPLHG